PQPRAAKERTRLGTTAESRLALMVLPRVLALRRNAVQVGTRSLAGLREARRLPSTTGGRALPGCESSRTTSAAAARSSRTCERCGDSFSGCRLFSRRFPRPRDARWKPGGRLKARTLKRVR